MNADSAPLQSQEERRKVVEYAQTPLPFFNTPLFNPCPYALPYQPTFTSYYSETGARFKSASHSAYRSNIGACPYHFDRSPVLLQRLAAYGGMHWTPATHCMGCLEDPRWPNGPQLEEATHLGRSAECVEMIIHGAYARSFQGSIVVSGISQASDRKFPSFLGLVLLWQVSDIVPIEDQARARLYENRVLPSEITTEAGK